jgi:hypothetical protein
MSIRPSIAAMRAVSRAVQPGSTVDVFAPTANPGTLTPMPPLKPLQGPEAGPPIEASGVFLIFCVPL